MADNKDQTSLNLIGMATNMFSANEDEVRAFLNAWDSELYIFKDTKSDRGKVLDDLIKDLREHALDKFNIEYDTKEK